MKPFQRARSGWEALIEVRQGSVGPHKGLGVIRRHPGGLAVVEGAPGGLERVRRSSSRAGQSREVLPKGGMPFRRAGGRETAGGSGGVRSPSRRARRGREALPKGRQQLEALLEGWYGSGGPARGWEA